jgi:hypothetical protein
MKKTILVTLAIALVFTFTACGGDDDDPGHTHTWGAWQSNATQHWKECTANDGAKSEVGNHDYDTDYVCTDCGYEHTHDYSTEWKSDATQHWHECSCGDKDEVADHDYDTDYVCTDCGYEHTHSYSDEWSSDATQHWHECSCGDKKDAANHDYDTEWSYDVTQHWHECICGAKKDDADHTGNPCTACGNWIWTAVSDSTFGNGMWFSSPINAIAYGNNKFVAVGGGGKMAYSTDGATWTAVADSTIWQYTYTGWDDETYTAAAYINAIAYGNNKWVAVGGGGKMAYSTDGATWTAVADSTIWDYTGTRRDDETYTATADINAIAYGNNKWVAVGGYGKMAYSTDGVSWTAGAENVLGTEYDMGNSINALAYGSNKFVAVGSYGKMATSTDGTSWTAVSNSTFDYTITAIAYGNNKFVAVGEGVKMATSTDGTSWTAVSNSTFGNSGINAIAYGNNKWVAVGGGNWEGKMAYSTDGASWTAVSSTNSTFDDTINAIAYGNGKFVAGNVGGSMAYVDWEDD